MLTNTIQYPKQAYGKEKLFNLERGMSGCLHIIMCLNFQLYVTILLNGFDIITKITSKMLKLT